jgi:hypothetical protein
MDTVSQMPLTQALSLCVNQVTVKLKFNLILLPVPTMITSRGT